MGALKQEGFDYTLQKVDGNYWITVDNISVYIIRQPCGLEMDSELSTLEAYSDDAVAMLELYAGVD